MLKAACPEEELLNIEALLFIILVLMKKLAPTSNIKKIKSIFIINNRILFI